MKFYIVTPAYNALQWLRGCVRSVADQVCDGVEVHHHVQDGASQDGSPEWLATWQNEHADIPGYSFTYESKADAGMYDALNTAWANLPADADMTAHLNSDEQYLPGALKAVSKAFVAYGRPDALSTAYFVVDADGRYICHRRPIKPWRWCSQTVSELITCACFHNAASFRKFAMRFDTQYRSIADLIMYRELVNSGARIKPVPGLLTSVYTVTGTNLGWTEITNHEKERLHSTMACYTPWLAVVTNEISSARRRWSNLWHTDPREFSLYLQEQTERTVYEIKRPTSHWGCRSVSGE